MVYIRLIPTLKSLIDPSLVQTLEISSTTYVNYRSLRNQYPDLELKSLIGSEDVVSNITIAQMQAPPPPQEHVQLMRELQLKHERRVYQKLVNPKKASRTYFEVTPDQGIRQMEKSVSFGLTFIFSFFLAGASGYLLGKYLFDYDHIQSMVVCIFFVITTIVVEALLFAIKSNRMDTIKAKKQRMKAQEQRPSRKVPQTKYTQQKKSQ